MKKAVIKAGGKQYLVVEGETINIDHLSEDKKTLEFVPIMVIDDSKTTVGTPEVKGAKVTASVIEQLVKGDKVTAIRYKTNKLVSKVRAHRQQYTQIKINKIA